MVQHALVERFGGVVQLGRNQHNGNSSTLVQSVLDRGRGRRSAAHQTNTRELHSARKDKGRGINGRGAGPSHSWDGTGPEKRQAILETNS